MRALLMDVGNSRLKWGVLEDGAIHRTGHITQAALRDEGIAVLTARLPRNVDTALICNVAGPGIAARLSGVIGMHCGVDVHFAHSERRACGVTNGYRQPRQLGVDRWVAMIGAWRDAEDTLLVVDAGTAVTIDAVDATGRHLGGQIIPGVSVMASSLASETSDIPTVRSRAKSQPRDAGMFAGTTAAAVAQGALNAVVGAVERAVDALYGNGATATVFLTGGDASSILKSLEMDALHRPHLVLQGLAHILEDRQ